MFKNGMPPCIVGNQLSSFHQRLIHCATLASSGKFNHATGFE